ncbi:hypothetical protein BDZ45DRAFT_663132 [Acephala macrosclerotiorum]|nr:hypothetical protein BDZ45DRAFT_663132 [Acephala macrosclerotiorum]
MFGLSVQIEKVDAPIFLQLPSAPARTGPLTLLTLPWDARHTILKCLLLNDTLGKLTSVYEDQTYGAEQKYGLSPSILGVCRQLYEEGFHVLYEQQPFYIACLPWMDRHISPLTRYVANTYTTPLRYLDAIEKIKHLNVIISGYGAHGNHVPLSFLDFCRALCHLSPKSINVGVILKGMESETVNNEDYEAIATVLQPLKLLRNLPPESLKIRDADIFEVPDNINLFDSASEYFSMLGDLPVEEMTDLMSIVEGNTPVELNFKMYDVLLKYCQAYELDHSFAADMALPPGEELSREFLGLEYENYCQFGNPYKGNIWHPVEDGLRMAREAALINNDTKAFKDERANVLMYLEKQYQAISDASINLIQFVSEEKSMYRGLLDVDKIGEQGVFPSQESCHTALLLVKDYAKSFKRESSLPTRVQISRNRLVKSLYLSTYRANLTQRLEEIFELEDYSNVATIFRQLVDELDEQLIKIRLARKELFKWNVDKDLGVDMHPADPVCAEHINWYAREPDMVPEFGENPEPMDSNPSEAGGSDGGDDDQGSNHDCDDSQGSESAGEDNSSAFGDGYSDEDGDNQDEADPEESG